MLDWASHTAAAHATRYWHYARGMPAGKAVKVGVWEAGHADGPFRGVVIFSMGANHFIGSPYGLEQHAVCELTRVALRAHHAPVSRILRIALLLLRRHCPTLQLIVSYADTAQGHHGGIYQAGGWIYVGASTKPRYRVHGAVIHSRTASLRYGDISIARLRAEVDPYAALVPMPPKHKYLLPLTSVMRAQLLPLARPYPKRESSV